MNLYHQSQPFPLSPNYTTSNHHAQKKRESNLLLHHKKHTLNIQIHHLRKLSIRMTLQRSSPRRPRIRKKNVDFIRRLAYFLDQSFDL